LKQGQYKPLRASEQIASLLSVTGGSLDNVPTEKVREVEVHVLRAVIEQLPELCGRIEAGNKLEITDRDSILFKVKAAVAPFEVIEEADANN
jgi:F-type H+-transporting ATPase subunit alpha